jgi:glycosyltransferase involved in cell wall biosynthesis
MSNNQDVALLTGGGDRPYAIGLATSLLEEGLAVDFIGSNELESPELGRHPRLRFLNLRGDQSPDASRVRKLLRVLAYYAKLMRYAATASPRVFHILWNNKLEYFDRTALLLYYRLMGRRIVLTVHNVNARVRDGNDGYLNRLTLRIQYTLADHLFVHTRRMQRDLEADFGVAEEDITVIPFGINDTIPMTPLSRTEARQRLGLSVSDKVVLFFGNIAPYKGLEYLVEALALVVPRMPECRLVIAGRVKESASDWSSLQRRIASLGLRQHVVSRIEYVPDAETEQFFKAADVLALPYTFVFQSGVLFLAYSFGVPVIASDVGSLKDDVIEGVTGFVCAPKDAADLAVKIEGYFRSDLYRLPESARPRIRQLASERYSWSAAGGATSRVYTRLLAKSPGGE